MDKPFSIDANLVFIWTLFGALLAAFASFAMPLTADRAALVTAWATFGLKVYSGITPVLAGYAKNNAGPLVGFPANVSQFPKAVLAFLAAALVMLLVTDDARAQTPIPPKRPAPVRASSNPLNMLADWADADVKSAIAASTQFPALQDQVGAACWAQISTLSGIVKAHPLPVSFHLATDIEYARLIQASLNQLCRNPACAQVWSDMANAAQSFSVTPLPMSFTSLCAKVPVVGLSVATTPAN